MVKHYPINYTIGHRNIEIYHLLLSSFFRTKYGCSIDGTQGSHSYFQRFYPLLHLRGFFHVFDCHTKKSCIVNLGPRYTQTAS
jgi:hypothetical protein